jgi:hypothetical protein
MRSANSGPQFSPCLIIEVSHHIDTDCISPFEGSTCQVWIMTSPINFQEWRDIQKPSQEASSAMSHSVDRENNNKFDNRHHETQAAIAFKTNNSINLKYEQPMSLVLSLLNTKPWMQRYLNRSCSYLQSESCFFKFADNFFCYQVHSSSCLLHRLPEVCGISWLQRKLSIQ